MLRFEGYAALWDVVDRAGDVFRREAFAEGTAPLLWQHRGRPVGRVRVHGDARGLCVAGEIEDADVARLVRCGALDGLSVGYRPRVVEQGAWRAILAAELVEVSLVAQPMQSGARVTMTGWPGLGTGSGRRWRSEYRSVPPGAPFFVCDGEKDMGEVMARPVLAGASAAARDVVFDGFVRTGAALETKAFTGVSGDAGGFAVPKEIDAVIDATLKAVSPIRSIANVVKVGSAGYRKLVTTGGTPSGWAAETGTRTETATPSFVEIAPPMGELYANPSASQAMLDDAQFDVEEWLANEIAVEFAKAEGAAFIAGSGTNRPKGFLTQPVAATADGARAFGTLQYLASGAAGDFGSNPQDRLIDLVQSLRGPYRQNGSFVMNAATLARIRKFKTTDGQFLWQPSLSAGQPATLLGYPVVEAEDMPDVAANALAIAFGDFRSGYLIAERTETAILRDPYSDKPFVNFYATKRVGGCVTNSEAIKLMRFSAS